MLVGGGSVVDSELIATLLAALLSIEVWSLGVLFSLAQRIKRLEVLVNNGFRRWECDGED